MKSLFFGILILLVVGIGGLVYRNAVQHPNQEVACPVDAKVCPDGTSVSRIGPSCAFPACPLPNVTLLSANISYAIPAGFSAVTGSTDPSVIAEYDAVDASSTATAAIFVRKYAVDASSTPLMTIEQTAVSYPSGQLVSAAALSTSVIGLHRFTVVTIERAQGTIDTAYYLNRGTDVLRFDAVDHNISNWNNPNLTIANLPAQKGLQYLLSTLQGD